MTICPLCGSSRSPLEKTISKEDWVDKRVEVFIFGKRRKGTIAGLDERSIWPLVVKFDDYPTDLHSIALCDAKIMPPLKLVDIHIRGLVPDMAEEVEDYLKKEGLEYTRQESKRK